MLRRGGDFLVLLSELDEQIRDGIAAHLCLGQNFCDVHKGVLLKKRLCRRFCVISLFSQRSYHDTPQLLMHCPICTAAEPQQHPKAYLQGSGA